MEYPRTGKHECPECGRKHLCPTEWEAIIKRFQSCLVCNQAFGGEYKVKDEVWTEAGLKNLDGVCHLHCLEQLLERPLVVEDFDDYPVNAALWFGIGLANRVLTRGHQGNPRPSDNRAS